LFVLSVDVRAPAGKTAESQASKLLVALERLHIPATWCLPNPGEGALPEQICRQSLHHEIALLGEAAWVGKTAGRTHFARELSQRVVAAQQRGLKIRSLALLDAELTDDLDLLVKHRISLLRSPSTTTVQPQSLRFGVWQAPVTFSLPTRTSWTFGGCEWTVGRALTRAARSGDLVHVVADLKGLANQVQFTTLERILGVVSRRQQKGLLTALTLQGLAQSLAPKRTTPVSQSVLRAA